MIGLCHLRENKSIFFRDRLWTAVSSSIHVRFGSTDIRWKALDLIRSFPGYLDWPASSIQPKSWIRVERADIKTSKYQVKSGNFLDILIISSLLFLFTRLPPNFLVEYWRGIYPDTPKMNELDQGLSSECLSSRNEHVSAKIQPFKDDHKKIDLFSLKWHKPII